MIDGPPGSLFADDGGTDEPAVLFVHSLAGNASQWSASLARLRGGGRRAVALELRGHGRSDPPADDDFSVEAYSRDVLAAADRIGLERFVLVGHSMGAAVAARAAAGAPERVSRLLLVDGAHARQEPTPDERAWLEALGSDAYAELIGEFWTSILGASEPPVRERVLADLRATPRRTVISSFRALVAHDPLDDLRSYAGPKALLLTDVGDNPAAPHHHLPDLPHMVIHGTGHWPQLDRPEPFADWLEKCLSEGDSGNGATSTPASRR